MTRNEYRKMITQKHNEMEEYYKSHRLHKCTISAIAAEKQWIKKCEELGLGDTMKAVNDYTFDMEHHNKLVENYTKSLPALTKRKLLAIKDVRDKGYLKQNEIEY